MIPRYGPSVWKVLGLSDVSVAAAGGILGPITFQMPRSVFLTSILLLPTSGLRANMAKLKLRVQDECFEDLISTSDGGHEATLLSLCGTTPIAAPMFDTLVLKRPFELQRPVRSGDCWLFTLTNNDAAAPLAVEALLLFEEGEAP